MEIDAKSDSPIRWHYTIGDRLEGILVAGELRPATAGVPAGEKPCVWFSVNQDWEPTANKLGKDGFGVLQALTKEETHELGGGLVRIGVSPSTAPHDWRAYKRLSCVTRDEAKGLYDSAIARGSRPGDWFVSFSAVPRSQWLAIEVWDGAKWIPFRNEDKGD